MRAVHLLFVAVLLSAQDRSPEKCTLSGSVVNSVTGKPLTKVELVAEPIEGEGKAGIAANTDPDGNFRLVNLAAGQYHLKAMRNGYLETYYGARRAGSTGTPIVLEAGQELKDLQVKLLPLGMIAGTVRDYDGEPMVGAAVEIQRRRYNETGERLTEPVVSDLATDDLGQYRVAALEPGTYYVTATSRGVNDYGFQTPIRQSAKADEPVIASLPTIYPGVINPTEARAVDVGLGARVTGIDITLVRSRVYDVRLRATAAAGLKFGGVFLTAGPEAGNLGLTFNSPRKQADGSYIFYGVPPGSYELMARAEALGPPTTPEMRFQRNYVARLPVTVNGDVDGLRIVVGLPAEVAGTMRAEGEKKPKLAGMKIHFARRDGYGALAQVAENGSFDAGLRAGPYQVYVNGVEKGWVVKSIRTEGIDVLREGLNVFETGKASIEIVIAPDAATMDGSVLDKDDKPVAGATVVAVAEPKLRVRHDSFHSATTDQYGRYHFENIRPGDYKLFAWDDIEPNSWFDAEVLKRFEDKGEAVTIHAKGQETLKLHLISNEQK